ncbi:hypothetical protein KR018_002271 [Drosophila ironensis]|nr:hypothetical protein KR018_002271 [Drosophila ironensis]
MDTLCSILSADIGSLLFQVISSLGRKVKGSQETCNRATFQQDIPKSARETRQKSKCHLVTHASFTIRNKYPGPLITYDGEAREEPRLINFSDLCHPKVAQMFDDKYCEKESKESIEQVKVKQERSVSNTSQAKVSKTKSNCSVAQKEGSKKHSKCSLRSSKTCSNASIDAKPDLRKRMRKQADKLQESVLDIIRNIFPKCSKNLKQGSSGCGKKDANSENHIDVDRKARALYEKHTCRTSNPVCWENLPSAEKLRFQWQAITGNKLRDTPYDNFRVGFMKAHQKCSSRAAVRREMRLQWCQMDRSQRMPFVLQALLYHVSVGAVDIQDHCAVRDLFRKLR